MNWHEILIGKLKEHSSLSRADITAIKELPCQKRILHPNDDIVRQGDIPDVSVVVLEGLVARYHTLKTGKRQYLSYHIAGDMPDAQALFLDRMDHSVCAVNKSTIATIKHKILLQLFEERPQIGFAIWRETLIDAAIFREAITNNSARTLQSRLAHFFCEQFYRGNQIGLINSDKYYLPLTQTQLGETLASSLPSISRTLNALRKGKTVNFKNGYLEIKNWNRLAQIGDFNPFYLHLKKPVD